jgi:hypothetical protein
MHFGAVVEDSMRKRLVQVEQDENWQYEHSMGGVLTSSSRGGETPQQIGQAMFVGCRHPKDNERSNFS